ncbi:hypothetical protein GCM10023091_00370 [Ravibacter arvi]|uniref:Uncharacterized protein n=1 Tax=Ravibacter arvi TaxID=2051041 RepID=A0ABP8LKZ0_9BACT
MRSSMENFQEIENMKTSKVESIDLYISLISNLSWENTSAQILKCLSIIGVAILAKSDFIWNLGIECLSQLIKEIYSKVRDCRKGEKSEYLKALVAIGFILRSIEVKSDIKPVTKIINKWLYKAKFLSIYELSYLQLYRTNNKTKMPLKKSNLVTIPGIGKNFLNENRDKVELLILASMRINNCVKYLDDYTLVHLPSYLIKEYYDTHNRYHKTLICLSLFMLFESNCDEIRSYKSDILRIIENEILIKEAVSSLTKDEQCLRCYIRDRWEIHSSECFLENDEHQFGNLNIFWVIMKNPKSFNFDFIISFVIATSLNFDKP